MWQVKYENEFDMIAAALEMCNRGFLELSKEKNNNRNNILKEDYGINKPCLSYVSTRWKEMVCDVNCT